MKEKSLFGTSGIRGDAEELFTSQFCYDIAATFVEYLRRHNLTSPIAVAMDPRQSGPRIKQDLLHGLASSGLSLFDEGITPIPSVNWLIKNTEVKAAIMITGSHIAPHLNGVKFYAHDEEISENDQKEIESIYHTFKGKNIPSGEVPVTVETRAKDLYEDMLYKLAQVPYPKYRLAVDCANGSQSVVMPKLLKRFGFEVIEINCSTTANFIGRDTDTDDKAELEALKGSVVKEACDFGIAYDGDGDRVVFIDEKGNFIQGEYSCSLVAKNTSSNTIVSTISASQVIEKLGKKVVRTKVGSPYVIAAMKENNALFGFEPNGGAVSGEIMYTRDGGSMTIKMLNFLKEKTLPFSKIVASLPKFYMYRTKVDYPWELKDKIIIEAKQNFQGIKVEEMDGLKIWKDENSWVLFRSSANAPEFRVFAESTSAQKAEELLKNGLKLVNDIISKSK